MCCSSKKFQLISAKSSIKVPIDAICLGLNSCNHSVFYYMIDGTAIDKDIVEGQGTEEDDKLEDDTQIADVCYTAFVLAYL